MDAVVAAAPAPAPAPATLAPAPPPQVPRPPAPLRPLLARLPPLLSPARPLALAPPSSLLPIPPLLALGLPAKPAAPAAPFRQTTPLPVSSAAWAFWTTRLSFLVSASAPSSCKVSQHGRFCLVCTIKQTVAPEFS